MFLKYLNFGRKFIIFKFLLFCCLFFLTSLQRKYHTFVSIENANNKAFKFHLVDISPFDAILYKEQCRHDVPGLLFFPFPFHRVMVDKAPLAASHGLPYGPISTHLAAGHFTEGNAIKTPDGDASRLV